MSEFASLIEVLSTGGDLGIFALIYFMWRLDRRLLKLEVAHEHRE